MGSIDLINDEVRKLRFALRLDLWHGKSGRLCMCDIEALVESYLAAEQALAAAVDALGGRIPLPDGRIVTSGRGEFDAEPGKQRRRAWVLIRRNAPMPVRR
jgi:hypothetical protein